MVGKCHKLPEPEFLHLYREAVKTGPFVRSCSTEQIIHWLEKMPDSEEPSKGHVSSLPGSGGAGNLDE